MSNQEEINELKKQLEFEKNAHERELRYEKQTKKEIFEELQEFKRKQVKDKEIWKDHLEHIKLNKEIEELSNMNNDE